MDQGSGLLGAADASTCEADRPSAASCSLADLNEGLLVESDAQEHQASAAGSSADMDDPVLQDIDTNLPLAQTTQPAHAKPAHSAVAVARPLRQVAGGALAQELRAQRPEAMCVRSIRTVAMQLRLARERENQDEDLCPPRVTASWLPLRTAFIKPFDEEEVDRIIQELRKV